MKPEIAAVCLLLFAGSLRADESAGQPDNRPLVRVAAISFVPTKLDLHGNAERLSDWFRQAHAGGAQLAVAPEGALDGYIVNEIIADALPEETMHQVALTMDAPVLQKMRQLAIELNMCLVFGLAERIGEDVFNCAVFIDTDGQLRGKYHKMQLAEGYHPSWWFNRLGNTSRAFDTSLGRCGILICNDRWNPLLARIPVLDGAQFLVIPAYGSCSPSQDAAVLSRAQENKVPVIEANVGLGLIADGQQIVAVERQQTGIVYADIAIPPPRSRDTTQRDQIEREFLEWRSAEMATRYRKTRERLDQRVGDE